MGFLDRLKVLGNPAFQAWLDTEERWAEILEFRWDGPERLRIADLRLALHFSDQPVQERTITCRVPKGVKPDVGQHVTFHYSSRGQYHEAAVVLEWDEPPHYGVQYDPQAAADQFLQQFTTPTAMPTPTTHASLQSKRDTLAQLRDSGALSEAEFEQAMQKLDRPAGT